MSALVRRDGDEGNRDYLDGRGVHCGVTLEVRIGSRTWVPVRYEVVLQREDRFSVLHLALPLSIDGPDTEVVLSANGLDLRWPVKP